MLAAIAIFAAAAAIAVVRATNSDDSVDPNAVQVTGVEPAVEEQAEQSTTTTDPNGTAAEPARQAEVAQQQLEEQQSVVESQPQPEPEQATALTDADQQQLEQEQAATDPAQDNPLRGFDIPIAGACVSEHPGHLPGASRTYRNDGIHEGLDFYQWASCTTISYATEIRAAKAGVVVRADLDYIEVTPEEWAQFEAANFAGEEILDRLRGRQVWIDHGRGVVTRYAHLSAIAEGIAVGVEVQQNQVIGNPGESGQQEVYLNPGTDIHLHFEIRIGDGWLGQGESPETGRLLYLQAFGQVNEQPLTED